MQVTMTADNGAYANNRARADDAMCTDFYRVVDNRIGAYANPVRQAGAGGDLRGGMNPWLGTSVKPERCDRLDETKLWVVR